MAELSQTDIDEIIAKHAPGYVVAPISDADVSVPDADTTAPDLPSRAKSREFALGIDGGVLPGREAVLDPLIAVRIMPSAAPDAPGGPLVRTVIINTTTGQVEAEQG